MNEAVNVGTAPVDATEIVDEAENEQDDADEAPSALFTEKEPAPPTPVNLGGDGKLKLVLQRTGEKLDVSYRNEDGTYNQQALDQIKHLMRSSYDEEEKPIAIKLVELLDNLEDEFGGRGLIILSGYRSPALNCRTPGAAKHSLHMLGWAADIRVPGYSNKLVSDYAHKLALGGVGFYWGRGFTHVDVGPARYWVKYPMRKRYRMCAIKVRGRHGRYRVIYRRYKISTPVRHAKTKHHSSVKGKKGAKAAVAAKKGKQSAAALKKSGTKKTALKASGKKNKNKAVRADAGKKAKNKTAVKKKTVKSASKAPAKAKKAKKAKAGKHKK